MQAVGENETAIYVVAVRLKCDRLSRALSKLLNCNASEKQYRLMEVIWYAIRRMRYTLTVSYFQIDEFSNWTTSAESIKIIFFIFTISGNIEMV